MKKYKEFFTIFLLVVASLCSYGSRYSKDSTVIIKINAKNFKNETIDYSTAIPSEFVSVKLDSNGEGVISLPVKKIAFIDIYTSGNIPYTLYLEPGTDMTLTEVKGKASFFGKYSVVNNFLLASKTLLSQLSDSLATIIDPISNLDRFIEFCNHDESDLLALYKKHYNSILPNKELDYILRANMRAFVLLKKAELLRYRFSSNEIDSMDLENKIGLKENGLLNDTLLIKFPSPFFIGYLNVNYVRFIDRTIEPILFYNNKFVAMRINAIETAPQYSKEIKEYLLFNELFQDMMAIGPQLSLDTLAERITKDHPEFVKYTSVLTTLFNHLTPGKLAPSLQGISPEGKVYSLNDYKGKVIFVDIWATWCSPCLEALPHTLELQKSFKNNKEVVFLFLSNNHDYEEEKWKNYLSSHPEFTGTHIRARDVDDRPLEYPWKVNGIPRYLLIDKEGKIIDAFINNTTDGILKEVINKALLK